MDDLVAEKAVGLFHGRKEYGPRGLGARSILGDSRSSIESLAIGNCYLEKSRQNSQLMKDYRNAFELD